MQTKASHFAIGAILQLEVYYSYRDHEPITCRSFNEISIKDGELSVCLTEIKVFWNQFYKTLDYHRDVGQICFSKENKVVLSLSFRDGLFFTFIYAR